MAALSYQSEYGALRIRATDDPPVAGDFDGTVEDLAALRFHAPERDIHVADVEVVKPERDRLRGRLGEHAADGEIADREQLIRTHWAAVGLRFPPAEKLAVELPCLLPIGGEQLVPADVAERIQLGSLLTAAVEPFEQPNGRHLRIDCDRDAADIGNIFRWHVHGAAELSDARGRAVDVLDS